MSRRIDKPTILNTLTTVGVWNGTIFYLTAPIPILNTFTTVGVLNGTVLYLTAPILIANFAVPPK